MKYPTGLINLHSRFNHYSDGIVGRGISDHIAHCMENIYGCTIQINRIYMEMIES